MQDEKIRGTHKKQVLGTIEVRRGRMETLILGKYDKGYEPPVTIELVPDMPEDITMNPVRVLQPDDRYELRLQIQNYGSFKCRVTVLTLV